MTEKENRAPLMVYCRNCGAPVRFDIIHQTYRCPSCSEESGIREEQERVLSWKTLQKRSSTVASAGKET